MEQEKGSGDVYAEAILAGLQALVTLLETPVARDALELTKTFETTTNYDTLGRLKRSLTQYLRRQGDLYYVGLLGHFNAGKSSTINSVLELWGGPDERETGLNPTDTTITLITCKENVPSLLGVVHEGRVTIRYTGVDSPILTNAVIADTPGTGDPNLQEEIARDFLPICDVVFFLFSAASPLDTTDMPLLIELHRRLKFMPVKFVVTRTDELAIDRAKPLTQGNLNHEKFKIFSREILERTNQLLKPKVYSENDFVFVDNKSQYNIDALRAYLKEKSNPEDANSRMMMHSHKVAYYLRSAKELKLFFSDFLDKKLTELNNIVNKAENSVTKYDELVRISNNNLTQSWFERHAKIMEIRKECEERFLAPTAPPDAVGTFLAVQVKKSEIAHHLNDLTQSSAGQFSTKLGLEMKLWLQRYLDGLKSDILQTPISEISAEACSIKLPTIQPDLESVRIVPISRLQKSWTELRDCQAAALNSAAGNLRQSISQAEKFLQSRESLLECKREVDVAVESLREDMSRFFETVVLYREGVFSLQTKKSISTLGIGEELDKLHTSFGEDEKDRYTSEIILRFFENLDANYDEATRRLVILEQNLLALSKESKLLKEPPPFFEQPSFWAESATLEAELLESCTRSLQSDSDKVIGKLVTQLSHLLAETRSGYDTEIRAARTRRFRRYGVALLLGALLPLGGYLTYSRIWNPVQLSLPATVFWGILSSMISDGIVFLAAYFSDSFPESVKQIEQRVQAKLGEEIRQLMDTELAALSFSACDETNLGSELLRIYNRVFNSGPVGWKVQAEEYLANLRIVYGQLRRIRNESMEVVRALCDSSAAYFNDHLKNLGELKSVTSEIKEDAISDSKDLLERTRAQLSGVKMRIEAIEFS